MRKRGQCDRRQVVPKQMYFWLFAIAVMAGPALPADKGAVPAALHAVLKLRPGLWEFANTPKVTGDTVISDAMTARIPTAQRAQFLSDTRRMISQPQKVRECMTPARFDQRLFSSAASDCTVTVVSNSASGIEVDTKCRGAGAGIQQDTDNKVAASSPISITSAMHAVVSQHGRTMTVDTTDNGRWLTADCGGVKDIQVLPD
jgi:hypothetical protein